MLKGTAMGTVGLASPASAKASNGARYDGVVYDPATHEILGDASVQYNKRQGRPVGIIRYGDERVKANRLVKREKKTVNKLGKELTVNKYDHVRHATKGNENSRIIERVRLKETSETGLTGYIDREGENRIAFTVSNSIPVSDLENLVEITGPSKTEVRQYD